jgi:hypothetical protein
MLVRSQRLALLAIGFSAAFALLTPTVVTALSIPVPFALCHDDPIAGICALRMRRGQSDAPCSRGDEHPSPDCRFFRVRTHYATGRSLALIIGSAGFRRGGIGRGIGICHGQVIAASDASILHLAPEAPIPPRHVCNSLLGREAMQ